MARFYQLLFTLCLLIGCQPETVVNNPFTYYSKDKSFYNTLVNQSETPKKVDREEVVRLVNSGYPIELALFNDGKFYYYLENLGDGTGVWKFQDGRLRLYAERTMFAMLMNVHAIDEFEQRIAVDFVDRFGTKYLELTVIQPDK